MLSYASLRNGDGAPRVTVYLNPELYASTTHSSELPGAPASLHSHIRQLRPASSEQKPPTFAQAQRAIRSHQAELAEHRLFSYLEQQGSFEDILAIAPRVTFFVMCFQDIIRLVPRLTTDPMLRKLGHTHEREDKGHDHWFLDDLEQFGVSSDLKLLFSDERAAIRDIVYEQIADVVRSRSDWARFGVVLALEAAGTEFFGKIIAVLERAGRARGLKYFARSHQRVEQSHEVLQDTWESRLTSLAIPREALTEVFAVIEHTFATMGRLATDLIEHIHATSSEKLARGA
jgi:hypothetical protein